MLYHKDVKLPRRIRGMVPTGVKVLTYSKHAYEQFFDKNGRITPPVRLDFSVCEVVEVSTDERANKVDKLVLRHPYADGKDDLCDLVVVCVPTPDKKVWFVKTVWLNLKTDTHKTLNIRRFAAEHAMTGK